MKKILHKYILWIIGTLFLSCLLIVGVFVNRNLSNSEEIPIEFSIENDSKNSTISLFESDNNQYYVFLPSYTQLDHVKFVIPDNEVVYIGNTIILNGMSCNKFELNTEYVLKHGNKSDLSIQFLQSANVATMYIDTATGNMDRIHKDKNYEENTSMLLFDEYGTVDCFDNACKINGRGNQTWGLDKKPYLLTLSSENSLLQMGSASKWVLLANATDETNIRNKIVYDLASELDFYWSPECKYVDIYLNGEYNGLYLLAEKIEVAPGRLDIDTYKDDFLCKLDLDTRLHDINYPLKSNLNRTIELVSPTNIDYDKFEEIELLVNQLEKTILSNKNLGLSSNFDLDSWVRRYLIDEIFSNIDSDITSSYFYFKDKIFFAGPIWDYDYCLGNNLRFENPSSFSANLFHKSSNVVSHYYSSLYKNKSFYNRMIEIYHSEFLPILHKLIKTEIQHLVNKVSSASKMNSLRWSDMFYQLLDSGLVLPTTPDSIRDFLSAKIDFLNSVWINKETYCNIQFELATNTYYINTSVKYNSLLKSPYLELENSEWIVKETGMPFEPNKPIVEDTILTLRHTQSESRRSIPKTEIITFMSIFVLIFLFLSLIFVKNRHKIKLSLIGKEKKNDYS